MNQKDNKQTEAYIRKNTDTIKTFELQRAQCICGEIRRVLVPSGDLEILRVTDEPCACGRFSCRLNTKLTSTIDTGLDSVLFTSNNA